MNPFLKFTRCKMLTFFVLLLTTILSPNVVIGTGTVSGGGGRGIFCENTSHLQHGRLLDLYEGEVIFGWPQASRLMSKNEAYSFFAHRIIELDHHPHSKYSIAEEEDQVRKGLEWWENRQFKFINDGDRLSDINDSFEPIIPKGCTIRQIANFYENKLVLVDSTLWHQMSPFDQVALVVHELVYAELRVERGHTNSTYSRFAVGKLGSLARLKGVSEIISRVPSYYHCESDSGDFPDHNYEFFVYPNCQNEWCPAEAKFVYLDGKSMQFLEPLRISGGAFDKFGKDHFKTSNPEEIDGYKVWLRIESGESSLSLKLSTSASSDFKDAYSSTVKCTKYTR